MLLPARKPRRFTAVEEFAEQVGRPLGHSGWHTLDQPLIDRFADVTADRQWIHVDAELAAHGPYGGRVAHGFLTLSLFPMLLAEVFQIDGFGLMINKGVDRVRFHAPVPAGDRVRAKVILMAARPRPKGYWEASLAVTVERACGDAPACVAEMVVLLASDTDRNSDSVGPRAL
jgi:acyl dehydratase